MRGRARCVEAEAKSVDAVVVLGIGHRPDTVVLTAWSFWKPVRVGDILSFFSSLTRIGRTSITVQVEVYAERFRAQGRYVKVTDPSLTYVAIDDNGQPRPIPDTGSP